MPFSSSSSKGTRNLDVELISVREGRFLEKLVPGRPVVSLQGKDLYLGMTGAWKLRAKEWTSLCGRNDDYNDNDDEETPLRNGSIPTVLILETNRQLRVTLESKRNATVLEEAQWETFVRTLQTLFDKHSTRRKETKVLRPSNNNNAHKRKAPLQSVSHHRRVFGRASASRQRPSASSNNAMPWDDDEEDLAALDNQWNHRSRSKPSRSKLQQQPPVEDFTSDEEEENQFDSSEKENDPLSQSSVDSQQQPAPTEPTDRPDKRKRRTKRARLARAKDDDSSDDDLFERTDRSMTTPVAQRLVSPSTLPAHGVKAIVEDEEDSSDANVEISSATINATVEEASVTDTTVSTTTTKGQTRVSNFFTVKQKGTGGAAGPPPARRIKIQESKPTDTPPRSSKVQTPATVRPLHRSSSNKLRLDQRTVTSTDWLAASPTRQPSSAQKRTKALFGHDSARSVALPTTTSKASTRHFQPKSSLSPSPADLTRELDDDPIDDEAISSPPRANKTLRRKLLANRPSWQRSTLTTTHSKTNRRSAVPYPKLNSAAGNSSTSSPPTSPCRLLSQLPEVTAPPARPCRGLRNLGNTCYLNASLQMLFTNRSFVARLLECNDNDTARKALDTPGTVPEPDKEFDRSSDDLTTDMDVTLPETPLDPAPLFHSLCDTARQLSQPTNDTSIVAVLPSKVKAAMDGKTDKFVGFQQRDAHEFLSDAIDFLHDELRAASNGDDDDDDVNEEAGETTPATKSNVGSSVCYPTDDFCLTVQVCLECSSCGYSRNKEEMYRHLSIDIGESDAKETASSPSATVVSQASVQQSLERFFQPEMRDIKCEKCLHGTQAKQTMRILSRPKALILHLKRFLVVEKRIDLPSSRDGEENQSPNSPSTPSKPAFRTEYILQKNKAPVALSSSISLDSFLVEPKKESTDKVGNAKATPESPTRAVTPSADTSVTHTDNYALQGIVHHIGSRASSGHYTADVIRRVPKISLDEKANEVKLAKPVLEDSWITFDDSNSARTSLSKIAANKFKQASAYMLLYTFAEEQSNATRELVEGGAIEECNVEIST